MFEFVTKHKRLIQIAFVLLIVPPFAFFGLESYTRSIGGANEIASVGGIPVTLTSAQVAARYVGNPAMSMTNGLLRGFISEADANATIIPASFPIVGGRPLSSLLAGGTNACPGHSDKDTNNGVVGWWFYMNFPATRTTWID